MSDSHSWIFAAVGVIFIGLSKAGFGGGLGMLTTPLCALVFGPKDAIGIVLPLLCVGDAFSLYHYRGKWDTANLRYLLPGAFFGILIGVQLIGRFSKDGLNTTIGVIAVVFVLFQFFKERILKAEGTFKPNHAIGVPFGLAAGVTSTFAHAAGPIGAMFLIPQRLPKEVFVSTTVLVFFWINWLKMPFFVIDRELVDLPLFAPQSLITWATLQKSLTLLPLVPVGVWLGVWLNRRIPEKAFLNVVYVLTALTGLQLIFRFDFTAWLR